MTADVFHDALALAAERDRLREVNAVLIEALRSLKRAIAAEVMFHGAGCSAGYLEAEARANAAIAKATAP